MENIPNNKNKICPDLLMGEVQVSVAVMSILTAVIGVFVALFLAKSEDYHCWPALMTSIISLFGFFVATLIYANASGNISRGSTSNALLNIKAGNIISEIFGVYPFLCSIPLTVNYYSHNLVLTLFVLGLCFVVFYVYEGKESDIISRYTNRKQQILFITIVSTLIGAVVACQVFGMERTTWVVMFILLIVLSVVAFWILRSAKNEFEVKD